MLTFKTQELQYKYFVEKFSLFIPQGHLLEKHKTVPIVKEKRNRQILCTSFVDLFEDVYYFLKFLFFIEYIFLHLYRSRFLLNLN